jgi:hypothetical protein
MWGGADAATPKSPARLADLAALAGIIAALIETRKAWDKRSDEAIGNALMAEFGVASWRPQLYAMRWLQRARQRGKAVKVRLHGTVIAMRGGFP